MAGDMNPRATAHLHPCPQRGELAVAGVVGRRCLRLGADRRRGAGRAHLRGEVGAVPDLTKEIRAILRRSKQSNR